MNTHISANKDLSGKEASALGAKYIRAAIKEKGLANIIVATGASQFEMLSHLIVEPDIAWNKVTAFHLDEYVGLTITHPASFRLYLWQRFASKLALPLKAFHYVNAETNPQKECDRLGEIIRQHPIDVAFVGIGENGHLAFNDPPADFETEKAYLVVNLDEACRKQQMGEGWFKTLNDVPKQAISMSCREIMKSGAIICTVPDERKARAVQGCVEGPVTNMMPGSILQKHGTCDLFLDTASASRLKR
jgi:glucosamine-6-phosphate deaminase